MEETIVKSPKLYYIEDKNGYQVEIPYEEADPDFWKGCKVSWKWEEKNTKLWDEKTQSMGYRSAKSSKNAVSLQDLPTPREMRKDLDKIFKDNKSDPQWDVAKKEWKEEHPGEKGMKFSSEKPRWQLMGPLWPMMEQVVQVLTRGAEKYEDDNWMHVSREEYIRAIMSHYSAYASGENRDKDMGSPHLANLICSALFLMWHDQRDEKHLDLYRGEEPN